jgi:peroxiredoxin
MQETAHSLTLQFYRLYKDCTSLCENFLLLYDKYMPRKFQLKFNDPAPDLEVLTAGGSSLRLSSLWAEHPLLLAFIRHFGCPQCKVMLEELQQYLPDLQRHHINIVVITQGTAAETLEFCQKYAPGILCLCDPQHTVYSAFGLGHGNLVQTLLDPQIWKGNAQARKKGYTPQMPPTGQDALLMSGVFIIGPDGRIRLPYYYDNIADHPPFALLLEGFMGTAWDKPLDSPLEPQ